MPAYAREDSIKTVIRLALKNDIPELTVSRLLEKLAAPTRATVSKAFARGDVGSWPEHLPFRHIRPQEPLRFYDALHPEHAGTLGVPNPRPLLAPRLANAIPTGVHSTQSLPHKVPASHSALVSWQQFPSPTPIPKVREAVHLQITHEAAPMPFNKLLSASLTHLPPSHSSLNAPSPTPSLTISHSSTPFLIYEDVDLVSRPHSEPPPSNAAAPSYQFNTLRPMIN